MSNLIAVAKAMRAMERKVLAVAGEAAIGTLERLVQAAATTRGRGSRSQRLGRIVWPSGALPERSEVAIISRIRDGLRVVAGFLGLQP
jgi:hypothetical protein